jgi:hypothetical protein
MRYDTATTNTQQKPNFSNKQRNTQIKEIPISSKNHRFNRSFYNVLQINKLVETRGGLLTAGGGERERLLQRLWREREDLRLTQVVGGVRERICD